MKILSVKDLRHSEIVDSCSLSPAAEGYSIHFKSGVKPKDRVK